MIHHSKCVPHLPSCGATEVWKVRPAVHPPLVPKLWLGWGTLSIWIASSDEDELISTKAHNHRHPLGFRCSNDGDDWVMLSQVSMARGLIAVHSAWRPGTVVPLRLTPSILEHLFLPSSHPEIQTLAPFPPSASRSNPSPQN